MNTNFRKPEHEQEARKQYLSEKDKIKSLLERIDLKLAVNYQSLSWGKVEGTKDARNYLILALHCIGGLTEQEKCDYHI